MQTPVCEEVAQKFHLPQTVATEEKQECAGGFGSGLLLLIRLDQNPFAHPAILHCLSLAASLHRGFERGVLLDRFVTFARLVCRILENPPQGAGWFIRAQAYSWGHRGRLLVSSYGAITGGPSEPWGAGG